MYCLTETTTQSFDYGSVNSDQLTDEQLLVDYRDNGQRASFEMLVKRYERELYNYLRHYLGNAEAAEDVFQATFLQVHLKSNRFEQERNFRPWLYRIATNQAIDYQRKNRRHQAVSLGGSDESESGTSGYNDSDLASDELKPDDQLMEHERAEQVREAIADLPETLKQTLYLVYFQRMKYREAAEVLCVPFGTIKSRLNIAMKKLNKLLAEMI